MKMLLKTRIPWRAFFNIASPTMMHPSHNPVKLCQKSFKGHKTCTYSTEAVLHLSEMQQRNKGRTNDRIQAIDE